MSTAPQPLAVGTNVRYHGSLEYMHGLYEVVATRDIGEARPELSAENQAKYADGVAYELWPPGQARNYQKRDNSLYFVRRDSVTPVTE